MYIHLRIKIKKNTAMKNIISIIICIFILSSCVTSETSLVPRQKATVTDRDSYTVLGKVSSTSVSNKVWLLFIPLGGSSDQGLYNRAYKKALKQYKGADGIMSEQADYKRVAVPLVVLTYVYKQVNVTGVAYHIKTDIELQREKENNLSNNN